MTKYGQLQIYATGANGTTTLGVTLTYATGTPATSTLTIPDWCLPGTLPAGVYRLGSSHRIKNMMLDTGTLCNIYAIDLNPDSTRALTKVAFLSQGSSAEYFVFYGATAW
jgi:hypothetical protein